MSKKISPEDRLGMTLVLAGLAHVMLILGLTFSPSDAKPGDELSMLDVTLVQTRSDKAPKKADFIGQANQQGGGESEQRERPSDLFSSPIPKPEEGVAPVPIAAQTVAPNDQPPQDREVITLARAPTEVQSTPRIERIEDKPLPKDQLVLDRELEAARLQASISNTTKTIASRPRKKFLSSSTRESIYAEYIQAWGAKVERVGNINYPEKARELNLEGSIIVTVSVKRDGSIDAIKITQSSGDQILDAAAIRAIELSAPFGTFPDDREARYDIIDITRTFVFLPGNQMRTE